VSGATTLVGLTLAVTAAYALSRFRFPGKQSGMQLLLITQMFPATLMLVPLYSILQKLGLLDSIGGLVLVYATSSLPFCVWMLKGYFDTIPRELEEAAIMDGASPAQVFIKIVLPLARPALAVTALFSFMQAWNEFILAATLLNDTARFTLPVALQRYVGEYKTEWGHFAAGALIISAPVMALFFALQKFLVGGLTAGAVKG
jgi:arabinogalactan oligomer/maltooligosaccharide transport system permease protein